MKSQKEIEDYLAKLLEEYKTVGDEAVAIIHTDCEKAFRLMKRTTEIVVIIGTIQWVLGVDRELPKWVDIKDD